MKQRHLLLNAVLFALCLVASNAQAGLVSVSGGFTSLSSDFQGNVAPTYVNGVQVCPPAPAGCDASDGLNQYLFPATTQTVDFYQIYQGTEFTHNVIEFTPASPQTVSGPGVPFLLGTFTIANGIWTEDADLGFTLTTFSPDDSALSKQIFTGFVHLSLTLNDSTDPNANADIYYLTDTKGQTLSDPNTGSPLGSIRIYELSDSPTGSNIGTVDLNGMIGSLDLTSLSNPTGAAFLNPTYAPLPTPEPSTLLLLGSALGLAGLRRFTR